MAIQHRRGSYTRLDPTRMTPGEWAIVLDDDPNASDGRAVYLCFEPGVVKRMTTYEDFLDWFADARETTLDELLADATDEVIEAYEILTANINDAEAARVAAETTRVTHENARETAEAERAEAEQARATAEEARQETIEDFTTKVSEGFFDGATFLPEVDTSGNITWTNDKGKPNPEPVNIKGEKGNDGVVIDLQSGLYAFQVVKGRLYLVCNDRESVPDFKLKSGHLFVKVG